MEVATVVAAVAAAVLAAAVAVTRRRRDAAAHGDRRRRRSGPGPTPPPGTVVLDVPGGDPTDPALARLATALAQDALRDDPSLDHVRVVDADGRELVQLPRSPRPPDADAPVGGPPAGPAPTAAGEREGPLLDLPDRDRGLADRVVLPAEVAAGLPPDAGGSDVVRALLELAGHDTTVDDGLVRTGHLAVLVLGGAGAITTHDLSRAYLRYRASGARRGLVILLGYVPPAELARRQRLAPDLTYVGPGALQRMADAAALGADPLRFAAGGLP